MRATAAHTPRREAGKGSAGDSGRPAEDVYDDGYLLVEHGHYHVACGGERLALSRKEFLVISRIARGAGRWVSKGELWAAVWGESAPFDETNLRVSVHYARRKLQRFGVEIENEPGKGYRITSRAVAPDPGQEL